MTDHEKHRERFKKRADEVSGRRRYSEFKRKQQGQVTKNDNHESVDKPPREYSDEELLEAFLTEMHSINEPQEILLPNDAELLGDTVFTLTWDGGGTNNGSYSVLRIGNFCFCLAEVAFGPFATVRDALEKSGLNFVTSATKSIQSSDLTAEELTKILAVAEDVERGFQLQINDEMWEFNWHGTWSSMKYEK